MSTPTMHFTVDEVANTIGHLGFDPGKIETQWEHPGGASPWMPVTADLTPHGPCLAIVGSVQDAIRFIVNLHLTAAGDRSHQLHTSLATHPCRYLHFPSGLTVFWPTIKIHDPWWRP